MDNNCKPSTSAAQQSVEFPIEFVKQKKLTTKFIYRSPDDKSKCFKFSKTFNKDGSSIEMKCDGCMKIYREKDKVKKKNTNVKSASCRKVGEDEKDFSRVEDPSRGHFLGCRPYNYSDETGPLRRLLPKFNGKFKLEIWEKPPGFLAIYRVPKPGKFPVCYFFSAMYGHHRDYQFTMSCKTCVAEKGENAEISKSESRLKIGGSVEEGFIQDPTVGHRSSCRPKSIAAVLAKHNVLGEEHLQKLIETCSTSPSTHETNEFFNVATETPLRAKSCNQTSRKYSKRKLLIKKVVNSKRDSKPAIESAKEESADDENAQPRVIGMPTRLQQRISAKQMAKRKLPHNGGEDTAGMDGDAVDPAVRPNSKISRAERHGAPQTHETVRADKVSEDQPSQDAGNQDDLSIIGEEDMPMVDDLVGVDVDIDDAGAAPNDSTISQQMQDDTAMNAEETAQPTADDQAVHISMENVDDEPTTDDRWPTVVELDPPQAFKKMFAVLDFKEEEVHVTRIGTVLWIDCFQEAKHAIGQIRRQFTIDYRLSRPDDQVIWTDIQLQLALNAQETAQIEAGVQPGTAEIQSPQFLRPIDSEVSLNATGGEQIAMVPEPTQMLTETINVLDFKESEVTVTEDEGITKIDCLRTTNSASGESSRQFTMHYDPSSSKIEVNWIEGNLTLRTENANVGGDNVLADQPGPAENFSQQVINQDNLANNADEDMFTGNDLDGMDVDIGDTVAGPNDSTISQPMQDDTASNAEETIQPTADDQPDSVSMDEDLVHTDVVPNNSTISQPMQDDAASNAEETVQTNAEDQPENVNVDDDLVDIDVAPNNFTISQPIQDDAAINAVATVQISADDQQVHASMDEDFVDIDDAPNTISQTLQCDTASNAEETAHTSDDVQADHTSMDVDLVDGGTGPNESRSRQPLQDDINSNTDETVQRGEGGSMEIPVEEPFNTEPAAQAEADDQIGPMQMEIPSHQVVNQEPPPLATTTEASTVRDPCAIEVFIDQNAAGEKIITVTDPTEAFKTTVDTLDFKDEEVTVNLYGRSLLINGLKQTADCEDYCVISRELTIQYQLPRAEVHVYWKPRLEQPDFTAEQTLRVQAFDNQEPPAPATAVEACSKRVLAKRKGYVRYAIHPLVIQNFDSEPNAENMVPDPTQAITKMCDVMDFKKDEITVGHSKELVLIDCKRAVNSEFGENNRRLTIQYRVPRCDLQVERIRRQLELTFIPYVERR